jgi:hypothetical protein
LPGGCKLADLPTPALNKRKLRVEAVLLYDGTIMLLSNHVRIIEIFKDVYPRMVFIFSMLLSH